MAIAIIPCQAEKAFKTHNRECAIFENWLNPVSGSLPFKDIAPIHIEKKNP
jgi:hypothetical protein